eukprot:Rhum_TRINITY_DN2915_c0_g1::Rhum_TRINITY_DN2915_c0_g1_i1::g.8866::m.8866
MLDRDAVVPVLYGSQTGRAKDVAYQVARRLAREGYRTSVGSVASCGFEGLAELCGDAGRRCAVFVVSTTGQGDAPDNMLAVWRRLLRRSCPRLDGLTHAVLALGDSSYDKYNYVGKMLHNRLGGLGSTPLCERGLCDDQDLNGLDDALAPWVDALVAALHAASSVSGAAPAAPPSPVQEDVYHPRYLAVLRAGGSGGGGGGGDGGPAPLDAPPAESGAPPLLRATVCENRRLTPEEHWQDVRHIALQLGVAAAADEAALAGYEAGCSLSILPRNPARSVAWMLGRLGLSGDEVVDVAVNPATGVALVGSDSLAGTAATVRTLLESVLGLEGVPGRAAFGALAQRCPAEAAEERAKLEEMASAEGAEELRFYCTKERRSFCEVLKDFPSVPVTLDLLLDIVPVQQRRQYSISSLPSATPSITVAVVAYKTPYGRAKAGLCSTYLAALKPGDAIDVAVCAPTATFPDADAPVVLIGPGTGVAPCRSLLQALQADDAEREAARGKATLVFGCRNRAADYLYGAEMEALARSGWLRAYETAFSRDQERKVYVQDVVRGCEAVSAAVVEALDDAEGAAGLVFISGSSKNMPQSVEKALAFCFMRARDMTEAEATAYIAGMKRKRRIQLDTWA